MGGTHHAARRSTEVLCVSSTMSSVTPGCGNEAGNGTCSLPTGCNTITAYNLDTKDYGKHGCVQVDAYAPLPYFMNPLLAACQLVNVAKPGQAPPLAEAQEDMRLFSPELADKHSEWPVTVRWLDFFHSIHFRRLHGRRTTHITAGYSRSLWLLCCDK